jgi:hypothetical protein
MKPLQAAVLLLVSAVPSLAQTTDGNAGVTADQLTRHNWAQIRPNFGYLHGCATGYSAFSFGEDGYFVFNRNIHGSWRLTPEGNVILRTKNGQTFTLIVAGPTLTYGQRNTVTGQEWAAPTPMRETQSSNYAANAASARPVAPGLPAPTVEGLTPRTAPTPPDVAVNPPYETVASGNLQFRSGDRFQECGE